MTYEIALDIKFPDNTHRTDYVAAETIREVRERADTIIRLERAEGNRVSVSEPQRVPAWRRG